MARVICISHATGSGGDEVGRRVATLLGFRHLDAEILGLAAAKEGLDAQLLAEVEQRRSIGKRLVEQIARAPLDELALLRHEPRPPSVEHLRELIRDAIRDVADEGSAVIVAHAASMTLAGFDGLLRVFVTASEETRERRIAGGDFLAGDTAARRIHREDVARADYLRRFYGIERELPTHYDLVVNTDALTIEEAAELIAHAARGVS
jgi:cytidylate kinase